MLNPTSKGSLSFYNTISIKGVQNVNLYAAACGISYGSQYESEFFGKDMRGAIRLRNNLYNKGTETVMSIEDAIYEVYAHLLAQNPDAKHAFDELEDTSSTVAAVEDALKRLKAEQHAVVPELAETLTEEVEVMGTEETSASDDEIAIPVSEEETVSAEEVLAAELIVEAPVEEEPVVEEPVAEESAVASVSESYAPMQEDVAASDDKTLVEAIAERRESTEVSKESSNSFLNVFHDKLTQEIDNFKLLPNSNTASILLGKIRSLVPNMEVIDIVYHKEILHALLIEFKGAASMLSSFRVLALGLSARA